MLAAAPLILLAFAQPGGTASPSTTERTDLRPRRVYVGAHGGYTYRQLRYHYALPHGATAGAEVLYRRPLARRGSTKPERAAWAVGAVLDWATMHEPAPDVSREQGYGLDFRVHWITARLAGLLGGGNDSLFGYGRLEFGPQFIHVNIWDTTIEDGAFRNRKQNRWDMELRLGGGLKWTVWRGLTLGADVAGTLSVVLGTPGFVGTGSAGWRW